MEQNMEIKQYDIKKIKDMPHIEHKFKYLPDKKLFIIERIETIFVNEAYFEAMKKPKPEEKKTENKVERKIGQFDDFE